MKKKEPGKIIQMPQAEQPVQARMENYAWLLPEAKKYWQANEAQATKTGHLDVITAFMFAALCQTWAHYLAMGEQLRRENYTCERNGRRIAHPLISAMNQQLKLFRQLSRDFGLWPGRRREE
jgi:P27 family predicted phage terminase small subunit